MPCQSFSAWERSRKRGTLWLIGDPPASLCPRSGNMPTRSSSVFSWSTMVPMINTTWPPPFEGKRTRLPGLRSPAYPCSFLRIHDERGRPQRRASACLCGPRRRASSCSACEISYRTTGSPCGQRRSSQILPPDRGRMEPRGWFDQDRHGNRKKTLNNVSDQRFRQLGLARMIGIGLGHLLPRVGIFGLSGQGCCSTDREVSAAKANSVRISVHRLHHSNSSRSGLPINLVARGCPCKNEGAISIPPATPEPQ